MLHAPSFASWTGTPKSSGFPRRGPGQGILKASSVPAECDAEHETRAKEMAQQIAGALGYCGVCAVEFFVMPEGSAEPLMAVIGRTSSMSSRPYVLQAR